MSKKIQVTVSDEIFDWLSNESKKRGTRVSTLVSILLGESRRNQLDQANMQVMFDKFRVLSSEQFSQMVAMGLDRVKNHINDDNKED